MIPITRPALDESELRAIDKVLRSGFLVQGAHVADFEDRCGEWLHAPQVVAVSSCTAALHVGLLAMGVGPGSVVAVPSFSWPATANAAVLAGAEPVFVDIEPTTCGMDPTALERVLQRRQVDTVVPVHAFGRLAAIEAIVELAGSAGAAVLEDAACAFGARRGDRFAGSFGAAGCFSFHPRKAITTGEGGLVTTKDEALARDVRLLRNHGLDVESGDFVLPGLNYRMTEMQAAMGSAQLNKAAGLLQERRILAERYGSLFHGSDVEPPDLGESGEHVVQSYVVRLPEHVAERRGELLSSLRTDGIEATVGTVHIPMTRYYRERFAVSPGDFPVTDDVAGRSVTLPLYPGMPAEDQELVVAKVLGWIDRAPGSP